jgi:hypothetical protein
MFLSDFDLENPRPLTDEETARLKALAALPDEDIDCSDIPPVPDDAFADAVRNPFQRRPR